MNQPPIHRKKSSAAASPETSVPPTSQSSDVLLTTTEAASKLKVSRPYVLMLCSAGKLGEVVTTEGGPRRVRSSAVEAYLAELTLQHESALSPRAAGVAAGLYDHPDGHFAVLRAEKPPDRLQAKNPRKKR